jgi:hypothetical protein
VSRLLAKPRHGQKRSRWQNQGKRKPLLTKMTTSKKSRKVRKTGQSEKGSEEGAAPASIAKENQSDGEDRGQSELRYHRDVGGVRIGGLRAKGIELEREAQARAEGLRSVFEGLSGLSARKAAEKLNADGVPTPAGGKWHATQVIRVRERC